MNTIKHFNLRTQPLFILKLHYISKYFGRSSNAQLTVWLCKHINDFETHFHEITDDHLRDAGIIL